MKSKVLLLLFFLFGFNMMGNSIEEIEKAKKNAAAEIAKYKERNSKITGEKKEIIKQIENTQKEISVIEKERAEITSEISIVSKNIEYGVINMGVTSAELNRTKTGYGAKIIAWDKYVKNRGNNPENSTVRKNFRGLLFGDLGRIERIENVQLDIKKVTAEIETEKKKLTSLKNKLEQNKKAIDKKVVDLNGLIDKLNKDEKDNKAKIAKLQKQMKDFDKKIAQIIASRATKSSESATIKTPKQPNKGIGASPVKGVVVDRLRIGKLSKPVSGNIVLNYGQSKNGVKSNGIEIASKRGTQIRAAARGKVVFAESFAGFGRVVMIDYGYNTVGVYGNLISCNVSVGTTVSAGTNIGILGLSSDGKAHFYYELRLNAKPTNPVPHFK
ncbi:murein hydrolase activator EnvC family protein [Fusobacterium sp. PH5-44]|uniref:murein hydrolase activator EnvC family protein n=1 Tax=unclassified Fusobacterium TaxID=2648384 RepID=UPI003D2230AE